MVSEKVIKDSISMALNRMAKESRLKTTDPVADILSKVFPAPGVFDEKEYENAVNVNDRSKIYQSVLDAQTTIAGADKPKLAATMRDAVTLIDQSAADDSDLQLVFGTKKAQAKSVYLKAKAKLNSVIVNMDAYITTDYNLDDPEVGLGGWATYADQKVHFEPAVAKVNDPAGAKLTIIHESCHLADASVDDKGYYGSSGFEAMSENDKVTNAAHYEEIPARKLKKSTYGDKYEFKPGVTTAGAPVTFADKVKRKVDEYLRQAWDKAVDVHTFLRDIRVKLLAGDKAQFNAKIARINEISKLMHLTIHQQPPATATINQLDIVLAEGVAHGTVQLQDEAAKHNVPMPPTDTEDFYKDQIVDDSLKAYNALTGTFADDKKLIAWLVKEYKKDL